MNGNNKPWTKNVIDISIASFCFHIKLNSGIRGKNKLLYGSELEFLNISHCGKIYSAILSAEISLWPFLL